VIHEGSSFSESLRVGSTIGSPAPEEDVDVIEPIRVTSNTEVVPHSDQRASTLRWSGMFNPTPVLPHLTVDKHMSATLPNWRTPSFDEAEGIWSRQNRQILLFCIGFVFPFGMLRFVSFMCFPLMAYTFSSMDYSCFSSLAHTTPMEAEDRGRACSGGGDFGRFVQFSGSDQMAEGEMVA